MTTVNRGIMAAKTAAIKAEMDRIEQAIKDQGKTKAELRAMFGLGDEAMRARLQALRLDGRIECHGGQKAKWFSVGGDAAAAYRADLRRQAAIKRRERIVQAEMNRPFVQRVIPAGQWRVTKIPQIRSIFDLGGQP